ncbi:hypothetical protein Ahia01_000536900, partial [Argonauta hians]
MSITETAMACAGVQFGCTYTTSTGTTLNNTPQLFLANNNNNNNIINQATAAVTSSSTSSSSPSSSVGGAAACCENGRPIVTDPCTGHATCACQLHPALLAAYPRVPAALREHIFANTGLSPSALLGTEPSAFYTPLKPVPPTATSYDIERTKETWKALTAGVTSPLTSHPCYAYDPAMVAAHSYTSYYQALDYNSATSRRKNATRE